MHHVLVVGGQTWGMGNELGPEECPHGDIRAACLECLADPPPPPPPGFCWCGARTTKGSRRCGACAVRADYHNRSKSYRDGKRTQDWGSTRKPDEVLPDPPERAPFRATRRAPKEFRSLCPGCGLEINLGQLVVRGEDGEVWHQICR